MIWSDCATTAVPAVNAGVRYTLRPASCGAAACVTSGCRIGRSWASRTFCQEVQSLGARYSAVGLAADVADQPGGVDHVVEVDHVPVDLLVDLPEDPDGLAGRAGADEDRACRPSSPTAFIIVSPSWLIAALEASHTTSELIFAKVAHLRMIISMSSPGGAPSAIS